ncbi:MAG: cytochrome c [Gammaproteobacteria bacterium]|nr:cytochrome c [Gammaproteobacteria bacterium]NIR85270.1 cytochrome c [Gammaproteobacteria bacterium]NIR88386.1 cytochrome c [Gammaproteobacteria bacterium]NIU06336.1 cytochrome c [Gammaproteobacteria bacterium]NIV53235.1 c-type cytochrome [Gammaproteobacteria bacterium]
MPSRINRLLTALTACVLVLGPGSIAAQGGDPERGREKSQQCAQCHGPEGNSAAAQFPRLAGQHADYIVKALEDYKSGARKNAIMAGFAGGLSEQDRKDLAAYFASQTGLKTITHFD